MSHLAKALFESLSIGLLGIAFAGATTAQANVRLFEGSWTVKSFGNERTGGTGASSIYSAVGLPQGIQCNARQPRCPFDSTPTDGSGNFHPFAGFFYYCAPWSNWQGLGTTARPAKGATVRTSPNGRPIPPLYRNPAFFTTAGQPNADFCVATSTGVTPGGKGLVQAGNPITGTWSALTNNLPNGYISFGAAPTDYPRGIRATGVVGDLYGRYYTYRYTYATLRHSSGFFGPGYGPGSFDIQYKQGALTVASINVKAGSAKFGGTMRMLGALTSKRCYFRNGGCSLGTVDWRYQDIGGSAATLHGVITAGYQAIETAYYYHSALMQKSTVVIVGSRFPWTTGSVTVAATGRGPHKTVHYAKGYDNRTATYGSGTVQLVSPTLTRWLRPAENFETGGIAMLRLRLFDPEPGDRDGVGDQLDNCSERWNPSQDDTDGDLCGNLCDVDYDNNGSVGFPDFGAFAAAFGTTDQEKMHRDPLPGAVGFPDFGFFAANFGVTPGPSGTTPGTTACP